MDKWGQNWYNFIWEEVLYGSRGRKEFDKQLVHYIDLFSHTHSLVIYIFLIMVPILLCFSTFNIWLFEIPEAFRNFQVSRQNCIELNFSNWIIFFLGFAILDIGLELTFLICTLPLEKNYINYEQRLELRVQNW
jgi:hypothetical protein